MLTGVCIIVAELCLLLRLALPDILAFAERRYADIYGDPFEHPHGDVPDLKSLFHSPLIITEAQRHHGDQ